MEETLEQKLSRAENLVKYMEENFVWNEILHVYEERVFIK